MASKTSEAPARVKVRLTKPHTHAGQLYAPGAELAVRPAQAKWLADQGVAETAKEG